MVLAIGLLGFATTERNKQFEINKNIEIFANLYKELNTYYVDEIDPGKLMRTGLESMVGSLDPFTNYIAESDIEGYRLATEGRYFGIGAKSEKIGDYVTITELYKDQPADAAGLRVGDQLIKINGRDTKGRSVDELKFLLQGSPNTKVDITVQRPGEKNPVVLELTRGEVNVPNVPYSGLIGQEKDIAYINLTTFTRNAGKNVSNALRDMRIEREGDLKGVVLDLRGNGGGLLSEAVNLCNVFIPKNELVVTTKGKVRDWDRSFRTLNTVIDEEVPVVVLINKTSASASEIVSGVMQDYDRGVLVGQRSYGKGLVQNTKDIGYNSKVKLTTAKYYIPSGRCIQSVEYEDGEPVDIPDDQRTPFQTRNGRTVLDGGGVAPDVKLESKENLPVIKALINKNLIFNFVTEYYGTEPAVAEVEELRFTDFDAFMQFLEDKDLAYQTKSERLLKTLQEQASKEGYEMEDAVAQLREQIKQEQKELIRDNQEVIVDLIEKEVAGRFYYQEGKVRIGLRNDPEVAEAIGLLNDTKRYQRILGYQK